MRSFKTDLHHRCSNISEFNVRGPHHPYPDLWLLHYFKYLSLLFLNTTAALTNPPPPSPSLTLIFSFPSIASFLETAPWLSLPWCPSQAPLPQTSRYRGARVQTVSRSLRECSGADPRAWAAGAALAAREVLRIVLVWVRGEVWARYEGRVWDVDVVWLGGVD